MRRAMLPFTCTVTTPTRTAELDGYGVPVETTKVREHRCDLQQSSRTEVLNGAVATITRWTLFLPPEVVLTSSARVEVEGRQFEVDGEPWTDRRPRVGMTVATLREVRR